MTKTKGLTTFDLKIIGIIFMFINHVHQMFYWTNVPEWMEWCGRPVATLFFFVSVIGFTHTRNKSKYLGRLLIGSWVMTLGTMLVTHFFSIGDMALQNNIFNDLFLGVLAMYGIDKLNQFRQTKKLSTLLIGLFCLIFPVLSYFVILSLITVVPINMARFLFLIPSGMTAENGMMIYLMPLMYLAKNKKAIQMLFIALASLFFLTRDPSAFMTTNTQWMMIFSLIPIFFFNGQKGRSMKSFFYVFYPAHIWILFIISAIIYQHFG